MDEMRGWRVVLSSLSATVLLVGGVGVLSVMLISFADRRYEIGLRKSMGASDGEILVQFLLEALVLAAVGAFVGTAGGAALCRAALADCFPWGLVVNPTGWPSPGPWPSRSPSSSASTPPSAPRASRPWRRCADAPEALQKYSRPVPGRAAQGGRQGEAPGQIRATKQRGQRLTHNG